jgi:phosphoribosylanthranilate isomerase
MSKELQIKVCGMRNPHNITDVDALNPNYIGMIFYAESPRNMDKNPDAIPETKAKKVGVFVDADMETIIKKAREFKFNIVQLHGNESPDTCAELTELGYKVFKAFKINDESTVSEIEPYKDKCEAFLFDTKTDKPGGSGRKFNWDKLNELGEVSKFFLSGGIGIGDAETILELKHKNLIGVDINSKFELEPGLKDDTLIRLFIESVQNQLV